MNTASRWSYDSFCRVWNFRQQNNKKCSFKKIYILVIGLVPLLPGTSFSDRTWGGSGIIMFCYNFTWKIKLKENGT